MGIKRANKRCSGGNGSAVCRPCPRSGWSSQKACPHNQSSHSPAKFLRLYLFTGIKVFCNSEKT